MSQLPAIVIPLVETETDPVDIGHVIASAIDATTRRLIHVAIAELGDPPGPWAWLALGSEARHEQSLVTDQDHALVFVDTRRARRRGRCVLRAARATRDRRARRGGDPSLPWWRHGRVRRVASGSGDVDADVPRAVGPVRCRRDGVLEHRARLPPGRRRARHRIDDRSAGAEGGGRGMARSEARVIGSGSPAPDGLLPRPARGVGRLSGRNTRREARRDHADHEPRRTFAVASGVASNRTIDRLRAASSLGGLDPDLAVGLEEAFRLLWRIRLRHQVSQLRAGDPADDQVDPRLLGPLTRRSLREAFKLITAGQRVLYDHVRPAPPMNAPPVRPRGIGGGPWRRAAYASLDFETTGLDLDGDDIISFGVIPIEGGRILPGRSTYREVRPDRPLKPASIAVHGLRPVDLEEASALGTVVDDLRDALAGRYVLAWAPRSKRRSWRGCSGVGRRGGGSRSSTSSGSRSSWSGRRRSPPGLLAHRRRRSTGRPGRAPASRARRCADHRPGLPRPAAGAGAARDHDTSTAASSQSGMKARFPLHSWRVVSGSGPEVTPIERNNRPDQGHGGKGGRDPSSGRSKGGTTASLA